jgi:Uma2 family endonuclease
MTAAQKRATLDEYLVLERASDVRHEYFAGVITAMAGASYRHNLIAGNIARSVGNQLAGRRCSVLPSDMRVRTISTLYTYPDVTIVCGDPEFSGAGEETLLNPVVVIEILSASTEAYDRGDKFEHYRSIPSLREYVLVAQDRMRVEHFERQAKGKWLLTTFRSAESPVVFPALEIEIPLAEIYAQVELPADPPLHAGEDTD